MKNITKETVAGYVCAKLPDFFSSGAAQLDVQEIGDGNINYVYRVQDPATQKSLIVKHAESAIRSSKREIGVGRSAIEARALIFMRELVPDYIPEIYLFDAENCSIFMQDMRAYQNLRFELIQHVRYEHLARHLADFCANTLIRTCDAVLQPEYKRAEAAQYVNIPLCEISERLVFTEPYFDIADNSVCEASRAFVKTEVYENTRLHLAVAKLKNLFKSKAQSLIHGDLHSGSVFVTPDRTCVLDPEFACYGPAGYDVGNVIGNFIFALANARYTIEDAAQRASYCNYILDTIAAFTDLFLQQSLDILAKETTDDMMRTLDFAQYYMSDIMTDTAGFAGTEMIRRIVGSAKVRDITDIKDAAQRADAEQFCIATAKNLILHASSFTCGRDYIDFLQSRL